MSTKDVLAVAVIAIAIAATLITITLAVLDHNNVKNNNQTRIATECVAHGGTWIRNQNLCVNSR